MKIKTSVALFVAGALALPASFAIADFSFKDGGGATQTALAFVCQSTKVCATTVLVDSTGTAAGTATNPISSSVADGANVTLGAKADAAWVSGSGSVVALLKSIASGISAALPTCGTLNTCVTIGGTFPVANSIGGASADLLYTGPTNNSHLVKSSAGTVFTMHITSNGVNQIGNLRLYDTGTSAPTCSSATGVIASFLIPSTTSSPMTRLDFGPAGINFTNSIGYCLTGAVASNDNTNYISNTQVNTVFK